jgi:hypothetical protein
MERAMHGTFDHWRATNPDDEFLGPEPVDEDEVEEPVIDEEWNASRGEYETVVTFASGTKFAVRQVSEWNDTWEVCGDNFYMDFQTLEQALNYLTDDEFVRAA